MDKYLLRHKNTGCFYVKNDLGVFYKIDKEKAKRFKSLRSVNMILKKMKHPENWEIIKIQE